MVGLSVDETGMSAVVLERTKDTFRIETVDFLPSRTGSGESAPEVLRQWVETHRLDGCRCCLVPPSSWISIYQIERPPVEEDELEEAVRWQIKDSIDMALDDAVIDSFIYPEDALRGGKSMLNVVVARKRDIRALVEMVQDSGLELVAIDIPDMAVRNVSNLYAEEGRSLAVLMVDGDTATISLFKNEMLYLSRQIIIDASVFTASGDKERREREFDRLCLEIQRSMDYFESQLNQIAPRRILVYAAADPKPVSDGVAERLNTETSILQIERLGIDIGSRELAFKGGASVVRAVGAALRKEAM